MDTEALLEHFVRQRTMLSMTLRRPTKRDLGLLAWRCSELDIEIFSEAGSVVLTKTTALAGSGRGPAMPAHEAQDRASLAWKGGRRTLPKHVRKQLKAERRIRAQELEFNAQRRLMREVLRGADPKLARGSRSDPRDMRRGGGRFAYKKGSAPLGPDPASALTTTRHLEAIGADNKGHQMLRMMGWSGGALGTGGDGLATPIAVDVKKGRRGLGH